MKNNKLWLLVGFITLVIVTALSVYLVSVKSSNFSNKYPEIITELEKLYGITGNFKVIGIKGKEIDQRDYRPQLCSDNARTDDWQGKYYKDA